MMSDYGSMWFGGGFMWFFWVFLFLALIWVIKSATDGNSKNSNNQGDESPIDILKKRYAKGEIDEDEYKHRLEKLKQ